MIIIQCAVFLFSAFVLKMGSPSIFFLSSADVAEVTWDPNRGKTFETPLRLWSSTFSMIDYSSQKACSFNWSFWVSLCRPSTTNRHGKDDCMVTMSNAVHTNPEWKKGTKISYFCLPWRCERRLIWTVSIFWRTSGSINRLPRLISMLLETMFHIMQTLSTKSEPCGGYSPT